MEICYVNVVHVSSRQCTYVYMYAIYINLCMRWCNWLVYESNKKPLLATYITLNEYWKVTENYIKNKINILRPRGTEWEINSVAALLKTTNDSREMAWLKVITSLLAPKGRSTKESKSIVDNMKNIYLILPNEVFENYCHEKSPW